MLVIAYVILCLLEEYLAHSWRTTWAWYLLYFAFHKVPSELRKWYWTAMEHFTAVSKCACRGINKRNVCFESFKSWNVAKCAQTKAHSGESGSCITLHSAETRGPPKLIFSRAGSSHVVEEERAKEGTCGGSTLWKKHRGGRELLTQNRWIGCSVLFWKIQTDWPRTR